MTICLWCHASLTTYPPLRALPDLEALRRFAAVVYPRFGAISSEPDAEAVARCLCAECWGLVVELGRRVAC